MRWCDVRARLAPRSGVGVIAPWLIIAPPNNPIIRLDLRLLDRIEIREENEEADADPSPYERGSELLLVCGEFEIGIYIADGPPAVEQIVREAAPLTRSNVSSSPIELRDSSSPSAGLLDAGEDVIPNEAPLDIEQFLVVGDDPVAQHGESLDVGDTSFLLEEVRAYALQGANLPLPAGHLLQAAMALFVVAAAERYAASRPAMI